MEQNDIRHKNIDKELRNAAVIDDDLSNTKKKEIKDEASNNSNEKAVISVELTEEEKFVFSQLGINPLVKLGTEYLNANNTAQLDKITNNKILSNEKIIKNSNEKKSKEEILSKTTDFGQNLIINDELTSKDSENKNYSDLDNAELNEEIDNSRRKRRRSSASDD